MSRPKHIKRREIIGALLASLVSAPLGAQNTTNKALSRSIAVTGFAADSQDELEKGHHLALLIASDLHHSGKFKALDPRQYSGVVVSAGAVPDFSNWRALKADALVTGRLSLQPDGRFTVEYRLWDVAAGQQVQGAQYFVAPDQLQGVAHLMAESIHQLLTGQSVRFENKN